MRYIRKDYRPEAAMTWRALYFGKHHVEEDDGK